MNSEAPNTSSPTVAQLQEARLKRWHQAGEALLTVENLRSWINAAGLVLFTPRPQIVAPAPTFVEAVLGRANPESSLQDIAEARNLMSRLIADGIALPLNLMGAHGTTADTPDFVVSAAVFSYIFTLRGDKAWKQPPATSGVVKVSNLALATYEAISAKGAMTAYDLATHLGKEVTEAACLRALNELWVHLRVIPLTQPDGKPTTWELASTRFGKQIKAGANAGLPSALSALISLYLGQVMVASEDEIESFLSPVAPRSRIREVAHALLNARQLNTIVVEGKTLLHVAGEAPSFGAAGTEATAAQPDTEESSVEGSADVGSRIKKYVPKPRKIGTGYLSKGKPAGFKPRPAARKGGFDGRSGDKHADGRGKREGFAPRPAAREERRGGGEGFAQRPAARDDRERRPFRRPKEGAPERRFDRPWDEERPRRKPEDAGGFRPSRKGGLAEDERGFKTRDERSGPRPPRREDSRQERRPRREDDRGFDRQPRRDANGRPDRPYQRRQQGPDRQGRDGGARESGSAAERPKFYRFDDPGRKRRGEDERPDRRGPRRDSDFRPPRKQASGDDRRPRREAGSDERPRGGRPGESRPFGKQKFSGGGSRFEKPRGGKPFQKKPSGRTPRPRRDESA